MPGRTRKSPDAGLKEKLARRCDIVRRTIFKTLSLHSFRVELIVANIVRLIMKIAIGMAALALAAMTALSAGAVAALYATEPAAAQACGADEVVWIDLDHGRFYHKSQTNYGKGNNGGYACMKVAHAQYREGHE